MTETPGTTPLTPEEQDWYQQKFGERYVAVQWHPGAASRKERRERQFRPKLHALKLAALEAERRNHPKGANR